MQTKSPSNVKIIDVSHWQNAIDWPKVAGDGVKGAIIKASDGVSGVDSTFKTNAINAVKSGLVVGFYHYAHPEKNDPKAEAAHFADTVKGYAAVLPLVLDVEGDASKVGGPTLTKWCVTFLQELERLSGHPVMIYTGGSFARTYLGKELRPWPLWIAHYGVDKPMDNSTWERWSMFQYTSSGKVAGIMGNVDMNAMEGDFFDNLTVVVKPADPNLVTVCVNGKKVAEGKLENGKTMVELRVLAEALGSNVDWNGATRTVNLT